MEKSHLAPTPTVVDVVHSGPYTAPMLRLTGELDHYAAEQFEQALRELVTESTHCILLDLTGLEYVDSGGIAAFSRLLRHLERRGWVGIIGMDERVKRLFVITGLASHPRLRFFDSQKEAFCGFQPRWIAPAGSKG